MTVQGTMPYPFWDPALASLPGLQGLAALQLPGLVQPDLLQGLTCPQLPQQQQQQQQQGTPQWSFLAELLSSPSRPSGAAAHTAALGAPQEPCSPATQADAAAPAGVAALCASQIPHCCGAGCSAATGGEGAAGGSRIGAQGQQQQQQQEVPLLRPDSPASDLPTQMDDDMLDCNACCFGLIDCSGDDLISPLQQQQPQQQRQEQDQCNAQLPSSSQPSSQQQQQQQQQMRCLTTHNWPSSTAPSSQPPNLAAAPQAPRAEQIPPVHALQPAPACPPQPPLAQDAALHEPSSASTDPHLVHSLVASLTTAHKQLALLQEMQVCSTCDRPSAGTTRHRFKPSAQPAVLIHTARAACAYTRRPERALSSESAA